MDDKFINRYATTFATWDTVAQLYQDTFKDIDLYNASYDLLLASLSDEDIVLEIGCGPGNITNYLLTQMPILKIHGIDVAPTMVDLARINNPTATFEVMDGRDIATLQHRYHAIICGFCLPYLALSDIDRLLLDCSQILNTDGLIYLSFIEGSRDQSGYEAGSTGDRMYVYYYTEYDIIDLLQKHSYSVQNISRIHYTKRDGKVDNHLVIIAQI